MATRTDIQKKRDQLVSDWFAFCVADQGYLLELLDQYAKRLSDEEIEQRWQEGGREEDTP